MDITTLALAKSHANKMLDDFQFDIPTGGSGATEKPWRILDTVDFSNVDNQESKALTWTNLDGITDILVFDNSTQNETETASGYNLYINDTLILQQFLPNQKLGTAHYWWAKAEYDGLVWYCQRSGAASSQSIATSNSSSNHFPYMLFKNIGVANKITFSVANPNYKNVIGTWEIWVR